MRFEFYQIIRLCCIIINRLAATIASAQKAAAYLHGRNVCRFCRSKNRHSPVVFIITLVAPAHPCARDTCAFLHIERLGAVAALRGAVTGAINIGMAALAARLPLHRACSKNVDVEFATAEAD